MVMCIFLFLLWLILNGKVTLEICLFGVVVTAAVYAFCVAALGCRPQTERRFLKRLGGYVVYGAILVREIIRANLAVMRVIWSRKPDYHPAIVRVHAEQADLQRDFSVEQDPQGKQQNKHSITSTTLFSYIYTYLICI